MRVVYLAKCKRSAARALDWLVAEGVDVVAVVASEPDEFTRILLDFIAATEPAAHDQDSWRTLLSQPREGVAKPAEH